MFQNVFQTFLIEPLYNGFIFLIGVMPQGDVGLAIIALTLIVRVALYPVFSAAIRTQMGMQAMQPELAEAQKKYKDDKEELARHQMVLMKKYNVRPFAGFAALFVQIPILIALYIAFFREGLPHVATSLLYSFVPGPAVVSVNFFGILDLLSPHNITLALLVAATQYLAIKLSVARTSTKAVTNALTPERQTAQNMQNNMMLYMMPAFIGVISYFFLSAVGLYFVTGNIFSVFQELLIRRKLR